MVCVPLWNALTICSRRCLTVRCCGVRLTGHEQAVATLKELAAKNANEFRVMHLPTQALVAAMNVSKPD